MTTPTHLSTIPAGGIHTQHVDDDWDAYTHGKPLTQRVVVALVQVAGIGSKNSEKGRLKRVAYEDLHLVEITDAHEADRLRHLITQTRAERGLMVTQPALFAATESEQVEQLKDLIKDWASEQDLPIAEVDVRWVEYFGGAENAASLTVQASRSAVQLKEFAFVVGALAEEEPGDSGVTAPEFSDTEDPS